MWRAGEAGGLAGMAGGKGVRPEEGERFQDEAADVAAMSVTTPKKLFTHSPSASSQ